MNHYRFIEVINVRDWLYIEDHCKAIDFIIHKGRVGEVYNIGGHNEMRNIDIVKLICKELGKPKSLITYVTDRKGHDMRYAIDPTKIHNELGWLQETKFADGIKRPLNGIWRTANGGKTSLVVNIKIIMRKCTEIDKKFAHSIRKKCANSNCNLGNHNRWVGYDNERK